MSTILFTWEHGGGLGHLKQMRPLVHALAGQGHRVFAALKDLSRARLVLGRDAVLLQAPTKTTPPNRRINAPLTFDQILHNLGYESIPELAAMVAAWRALYQFIRPDLILFDHSPTAMLVNASVSSRTRACRTATKRLCDVELQTSKRIATFLLTRPPA